MIFTNLLITVNPLKLLDISKAFDKVWHKGVFFKLKQNGDPLE